MLKITFYFTVGCWVFALNIPEIKGQFQPNPFNSYQGTPNFFKYPTSGYEYLASTSASTKPSIFSFLLGKDFGASCPSGSIGLGPLPFCADFYLFLEYIIKTASWIFRTKLMPYLTPFS